MGLAVLHVFPGLQLIWRQVADLARGSRPEILVRGPGGSYAAGFIPPPMQLGAGLR